MFLQGLRTLNKYVLKSRGTLRRSIYDTLNHTQSKPHHTISIITSIKCQKFHMNTSTHSKSHKLLLCHPFSTKPTNENFDDITDGTDMNDPPFDQNAAIPPLPRSSKDKTPIYERPDWVLIGV